MNTMMDYHFESPLNPPNVKLTDMDYRVILRKMLMQLKYSDLPVGENKGSNHPKQVALVPFVENNIPFLPALYDVINLTIIYKPEMEKPDFMNRPSWGSYTLIYPHGRFRNQAEAIITSLSKYDRRRAGMKVYMDGHLDVILEQFGNPAYDVEFCEDYKFEMRDSLCVVQAPKNDVTDDPYGHIVGADRYAWICAMLLLYNFLPIDYCKEYQAMKQIVYFFEFVHRHGQWPKNCYKEKLAPGDFSIAQPPIPGRNAVERAREQAELENRIPILDATPFTLVPRPPSPPQRGAVAPGEPPP